VWELGHIFGTLPELSHSLVIPHCAPDVAPKIQNGKSRGWDSRVMWGWTDGLKASALGSHFGHQLDNYTLKQNI